MNINELVAMQAAYTQVDLPYLPLPNRVDVVLTSLEAPPDVTMTAFVLPYLPDGTLVMACNQRRGLEIPGGHIEQGENARVAAMRETLEEAGCVVPDLVPLGILRMHSDGTPPQGWRYPHPVGCQQFYAALVDRRVDYVVNDECAMPVLVSPQQAVDPDGPLDAAQRAWHRAAHAVLFGPAAECSRDTPEIRPL